ncbi:hypothetical protein SH412_001643 [Planctellipticum variicoloris]|nr:hypothetical protein SH412_001643 [Planctomycetaceae bacterium SH412]
MALAARAKFVQGGWPAMGRTDIGAFQAGALRCDVIPSGTMAPFAANVRNQAGQLVIFDRESGRVTAETIRQLLPIENAAEVLDLFDGLRAIRMTDGQSQPVELVVVGGPMFEADGAPLPMRQQRQERNRVRSGPEGIRQRELLLAEDGRKGNRKSLAIKVIPQVPATSRICELDARQLPGKVEFSGQMKGVSVPAGFVGRGNFTVALQASG